MCVHKANTAMNNTFLGRHYQDAYPNNKDPFDQRKAKSTDSTIPSSYGVGDTEG